jgi:hypothetical protein
MSRKKKPELVVDEKGRAWDPDDFFLDSHGVEAPEREVFELAAEQGCRPEDMNKVVRERYRKYLERKKKAR